MIAGMLLLAELAVFAVLSGHAAMQIRGFIVGLPLIVFIARRPVVGVFALTFLIPMELFARIPNEFFSLYKLLGVFTLTATIVHALSAKRAVATQRTSLHRWVFAFLFLAASSMVWSIEPDLTIQAVRRFATLIVFYFLVIHLIDTREKLRIVLGLMVSAALLGAVFAIVAYLRGQAVFDTQVAGTVEGQIRAMGANLDANFFSATILVALPICLFMISIEKAPWIRLFLVASAFLIVLAVVYSFSRGGALTMGLILLMTFFGYLVRLKGKVLLMGLGGGLLALLILSVLVPSAYVGRVRSLESPMRGDESVRGRWLYVQFGSEAVRENPFGVGAGAFPIAFRDSRFDQMYHYYDMERGDVQRGRSAHNMFLEVGVETGILGGVIFASMILFALYENRKTAGRVGRTGRRDLGAANDALFVGLTAFSFASLFLSAQYDKTLWLLLALVPVIRNLAWEGEVAMPDARKLRRALARRGRAR